MLLPTRLRHSECGNILMGSIDGGSIYYCSHCGSDKDYLDSRGEHPKFDNDIPYLMFVSLADRPLLEREAMTLEDFAIFADHIAERAQLPGDLEAIVILRRIVTNKQRKMDITYPTSEKDFQLYLRAVSRLKALIPGGN